MAKIIKSAKFHVTIKAILLAFIFFVFLKVLLLDHIEEIVSFGSEVGDIFYQLALSYIGGYIFYWIANFQNERIEHEKNETINKSNLERLIFLGEKSIFTYIAYIGLRDSIENVSDILDLNISGKKLLIEVNTKGLTSIARQSHDNFDLKPFLFYDELLECSEDLNKEIDNCRNYIQFMPIKLLKIFINLSDNYGVIYSLKDLKWRHDIYNNYKNLGKKFYKINDVDNSIINKDFCDLQKHIKDLKYYYQETFKDFQPIFDTDKNRLDWNTIYDIKLSKID